MRADVYIVTEPRRDQPIALLAFPESLDDGVGLARLEVPMSAPSSFALDTISDLIDAGIEFRIGDYPIDTAPMASMSGADTGSILEWAAVLALKVRDVIADAAREEMEFFAGSRNAKPGRN